MKHNIIMVTGGNYEAVLTPDQFENLKRLLNSDKTSLFLLPGTTTHIAPNKIVAIEAVVEAAI